MPMLKNPALKYRPAAPVGLQDRRWPDQILTQAPLWCSVDLRDGNQALIEPMDTTRKLRLFEALVRTGFKHIEVGFPSASQADFDFVRLLIDEDRIPADVTIQVLTPARAPLIDRTFEALDGVPRAIVHLYNAVSPVMRQVVLGLDQDGVVALATRHAQQIRDLAAARPHTAWTFQYSPEMFSNTELDFSVRVVDAVTAVWAPTAAWPCIINLPSTVECSTPNLFADRVEWMHRHLARRDALLLSIHPHNDRGTGTAAAELALMAGADRLEGCLFGNGERTGNLDLVNVALNLYTQGVSPGLDFSDIDALRRTVEHCNQLPVHPRHPYVGDLVYTSFSGSHQDAIKKAFAARRDGAVWDIPYLPVDPKDLGRSYEAVIRVNSQSGKGGVAYLLESDHGLELPRRLQIEFSQVVQAVLDVQGAEMSSADLWTLFSREYRTDSAHLLGVELIELPRPEDGTAEISVKTHWRGPQHEQRIEGQGNGPLAAFVAGVQAATGVCVEVLDYHEHAMSGGAQACAVAYVELRIGGSRTLFGVGIDANLTTASMKAVLSGVQRALGDATNQAANPAEEIPA
jgi:2-isopropylmalate synthase